MFDLNVTKRRIMFSGIKQSFIGQRNETTGLFPREMIA